VGHRREARRILRGSCEARLSESTIHDPYHAIGLARNPFIIEEAPGVAKDVWIDRDLGEPPLPSKATLVQILGPCGAGKTSHLLRWRERFHGPYRHIPDSLMRWYPPPIAAIAYWDEADRIPFPVLHLALRAAARRGDTIVAGTHRDLAPAARRVGLSVTTLALPSLDAPTLAIWIDRRIAAARNAEGSIEPPRPDVTEIERLVAECGGSFRIAADRLHVWMAGKNRVTSQ
jgi:hypothetical protein